MTEPFACPVVGCEFRCEWPGELQKHAPVHEPQAPPAEMEFARGQCAAIIARLQRVPSRRQRPSVLDVIGVLDAA